MFIQRIQNPAEDYRPRATSSGLWRGPSWTNRRRQLETGAIPITNGKFFHGGGTNNPLEVGKPLFLINDGNKGGKWVILLLDLRKLHPLYLGCLEQTWSWDLINRIYGDLMRFDQSTEKVSSLAGEKKQRSEILEDSWTIEPCSWIGWDEPPWIFECGCHWGKAQGRRGRGKATWRWMRWDISRCRGNPTWIRQKMSCCYGFFPKFV